MSTNSNYLIILVSKIKIKVKNIKFKNRGNFIFYFLYKQIFDQIKFIILKKKDKWNNEKLKEKVKKEREMHFKCCESRKSQYEKSKSWS